MEKNMNYHITDYAKKRHAAKAYDASKKITAEDVERIKELLRFSPSSVNSQPWHFILASTEEGKKRIAKSTERLYPFNRNAILNASHVVVFCGRQNIDDAYLAAILEQEEKDGRFAGDDDSLKAKVNLGRNKFVNIHKNDLQDLPQWVGKQVYLNVGQFLLGVAALGLDATPMEGIDQTVLDEEFDLAEQGYTSLVVVTLGYHSEDDYNANLPKSRFSYDTILTEV